VQQEKKKKKSMSAEFHTLTMFERSDAATTRDEVKARAFCSIVFHQNKCFDFDGACHLVDTFTRWSENLNLQR
jgi:hypothetical protein